MRKGPSVLILPLVAACLAIAAAVAVIEIRHWYKYHVRLPANRLPLVTWGHDVKNNQFGFRERDFNPETLHEGNAFVIAVLGDSLTWGAGLEESERYSAILEKELRLAYPGRKITVLNFGVSGGATTHERDVFRRVAPVVKPDLTIVGFCYNDPQERDENFSDERERYFRPLRPGLSALRFFRLNGTAKLIGAAYENALISAGRIPAWMSALDRCYKTDSREWGEFKQALKDISSLSREFSPRPPVFITLNLGVFYQPTDYNRLPPQLEHYLVWNHQAEAAAGEAGFTAVNCEEEFRKAGPQMMAIIPYEDAHPTASMNRSYAAKLLSIIRERRYLEVNAEAGG